MSKKEKLLKKLSSAELLELARPLARVPMGSRTTRTELVGMLKGALSVEEIKRKKREIEATRHIRARRRNQFLAVLLISVIAYCSLVLAYLSTLNSISPNELSVEEKWSKKYDVGQYSAVSARGTFDGGFIMIGWGATNLLKTDSVGNLQWNRSIAGRCASSVDQTSDGGYIIGGPTIYEVDSDYSWLVKTHPDGTVQWSNDHVGIANSSVSSVQQTSDGGYIIAGAILQSSSLNSRSLIWWVEKTDQDGNMLWNLTDKNIITHSHAFSAEETANGGYIIAAALSGGILLIKTYSNGQQQWSSFLYRWQAELSGNCLEQTSDGGYVIAGYATSLVPRFGVDFWLGKTDQNGNMQWNRTYGGNDIDEASWVQQTDDGGYILTGDTRSDSDIYSLFPRSVLLVKTDPIGHLQWESVYGGGGDAKVLFIQQRSDMEYVIAGASIMNGTYWLVEVAPPQPSALSIAIPVALAISGLVVSMCLVLMGWKLNRSRKELATHEENVDLSDEAPSVITLVKFVS